MVWQVLGGADAVERTTVVCAGVLAVIGEANALLRKTDDAREQALNLSIGAVVPSQESAHRLSSLLCMVCLGRCLDLADSAVIYSYCSRDHARGTGRLVTMKRSGSVGKSSP